MRDIVLPSAGQARALRGRRVGVEQKVEALTEIGRALFAEDQGKRGKNGLLIGFLRRQDAEGAWERRCRECGDFMPEHPEFFAKHGGKIAWICRDCELERRRETSKKHSQASNHNKRARRVQAEGKITKAIVEAKWKQQKGRCHWCGSVLHKSGERGTPFATFHVDHVIPLSKGGSNLPENIVLACPTCNTRKNAKDPEEFALLLKSEAAPKI